MSKENKKFIPNSFQITNSIVDEILPVMSGNALKCYLLITRKTRGWHKEKDSISISQFKKYTGIKRSETITKSINELLYYGLISNIKINGKITKYSLKNHNGLTVPPLKNTTPKKPYTPPLKNRTGTPPKKPCTTKDTKKTTNIKDNKSKPKNNYPTELNVQAWELWKQHKKEKKQSYKPSGEKTAIKKLCRLPYDKQMICIENSVSNNYTGFFIEKYTGEQNANKSNLTASEKARANEAYWAAQEQAAYN